MRTRTWARSRRPNASARGGWPTTPVSVCACGTSTRPLRSWATCVRCTWRARSRRPSCWCCTRPWPWSSAWNNKSEVSASLLRAEMHSAAFPLHWWCRDCLCQIQSRMSLGGREWSGKVWEERFVPKFILMNNNIVLSHRFYATYIMTMEQHNDVIKTSSWSLEIDIKKVKPQYRCWCE